MRTNTESTSQLLASGLSKYVAEDDGIIPRGFGLRQVDRTSDFHWLYWGGCPVVRTRDAERLVYALEQHLSIPDATPPASLIVDLPAAVTDNGRAVLLPREFRNAFTLIDRRLRESGIRLIDGPLTVVDLAKAEIVVADPIVRIDTVARAKLVDALGSSRVEDHVGSGRYQLHRWFVATDDESVPSSASLVSSLLGAVARPFSVAEGIGLLAPLLERVRVQVIPTDVRSAARIVSASADSD